MKKNIVFSFILSLILIWNSIPQTFAVNDNVGRIVAEAILGKTLVQKGFEIVEMGNDTGANVVVRDGSNCWLMDTLQGDAKAYINFTFDDQFKKDNNGGSVYEFEIEYYDSGNGYIRIEYDSLNRDTETMGTIYTKNGRTWKTARFSVSDALFAERLNGKYDFRLSIKAQSDRTKISSESIAVRRVVVKRIIGKNPIYVTASIDEIGNTFKWFSKDKIIHHKFENLTDEAVTVHVRYWLENADHIVPFAKTETLSFGPREVKNIDLNIGELTRCDVYWYYITIKSDDGKIDSLFKPFEVAIVKTDPDGILNKDIMFAAHFYRYPEEQIHMGVEMVKLSNSYGIRSGVSWLEMEKAKGALNWDGHPMKIVVQALKENGLHLLPIMSYNNTLYADAEIVLPKTPEQLEGWRNYVRYTANILKDFVDEYEIWNEPNISSFNKYLDGGDVYMEVFKVAYEEIKKIDPTAKLGGPSLTGISNTVHKNYFKETMDAELWKYAEAIALHPYTKMAAEHSDMQNALQWYKDEYEKMGIHDPDIWITEAGYTTADDTVGDERTKGAFNCRSAILYKSKDLGERIVFYNFEKKGTVETDREDQFGHVSPGRPQSPKYGKWYVPTVSYAMITGYNYVMAESEADGIFDSPDKNIRISRFKSNKFHSKIVTLYSVDRKEFVTLDLGTDIK